MALKHIIAVIDPTRVEQPAMERAIISARETGATLHLLTCVYQKTEGSRSSINPDLVRPAILNEYQNRMQVVRQMPILEGITLDIHVIWSEDPAQTIVEFAARLSADMIFKDIDKAAGAGRMFHRGTDMQLLRTAPCPVLLAKPTDGWKGRRILAAVDILSRDEAHQLLNNTIISFAQRFSAAHGAEVHFVNAYSDSLHYPDRRLLAERCGVSSEQIHTRAAAPEEAIIEVAHELEVDLVLLGTVGRKGVSGWVIGNTCEKVIDRVHCDVLTVN